MTRHTKSANSSIRSLTREEVESTLAKLGAWDHGQQTRPLTRDDLDRLMTNNAKMLHRSELTGEQLDLSNFVFCDDINLEKANFEHARLCNVRLMGANLENARLGHADFYGALLSHANLNDAQLHDANMKSVWANNINLENAALYRINLEGADIRFGNFKNAKLDNGSLQEATMWRANLQDTDLVSADLRKADLWAANLKGADLSGVNLQNTNLKDANLQDASFGIVTVENTLPILASLDNTCLDGVNWSHQYISIEEKKKNYSAAISVYRILKQSHERAGLYDLADQFAYREQIVRRKESLKNQRWILFISLSLAEALFGYGYRWNRVVVSGFAVLIVFTLLYWLGGLFGVHYGLTELGKSLYFSAVSFTGLGYGAWVPDSASLVKYLGPIESLCGVFLMALFLVTFTRRYIR